MATPTYTPIASITLGSSASSVTFSSIPQTYRDLVLVMSASDDGGTNTDVALEFNGSSANISFVQAFGTGSSDGSETQTFVRMRNKGQNIMQFMDYSSTDKHKTVLGRTSNLGDAVKMHTTRFASTAALTSFSVTGTLLTGSTFALYGIAA